MKGKGGWSWPGVAGFIGSAGGAIVRALSKDDEGADTQGELTVINPSPTR